MTLRRGGRVDGENVGEWQKTTLQSVHFKRELVQQVKTKSTRKNRTDREMS